MEYSKNKNYIEDENMDNYIDKIIKNRTNFYKEIDFEDLIGTHLATGSIEHILINYQKIWGEPDELQLFFFELDGFQYILKENLAENNYNYSFKLYKGERKKTILLFPLEIRCEWNNEGIFKIYNNNNDKIIFYIFSNRK